MEQAHLLQKNACGGAPQGFRRACWTAYQYFTSPEFISETFTPSLLGLGFGQAPGGESGREQSGVQQFALCTWAPTVQR